MKVYKIASLSKKFYGCILIAANSKEEAKNLFIEGHPFNEILLKEANCVITEIRGLIYKGNRIILLDNMRFINL